MDKHVINTTTTNTTNTGTPTDNTATEEMEVAEGIQGKPNVIEKTTAVSKIKITKAPSQIAADHQDGADYKLFTSSSSNLNQPILTSLNNLNVHSLTTTLSPPPISFSTAFAKLTVYTSVEAEALYRNAMEAATLLPQYVVDPQVVVKATEASKLFITQLGYLDPSNPANLEILREIFTSINGMIQDLRSLDDRIRVDQARLSAKEAVDAIRASIKSVLIPSSLPLPPKPTSISTPVPPLAQVSSSSQQTSVPILPPSNPENAAKREHYIQSAFRVLSEVDQNTRNAIISQLPHSQVQEALSSPHMHTNALQTDHLSTLPSLYPQVPFSSSGQLFQQSSSGMMVPASQFNSGKISLKPSKLVVPPTFFDGRLGVREFLHALDSCYELNGITSNVERVALAGHFLTSFARIWFTEQIHEGSILKNSFSSFKQAMLNQFADPNQTFLDLELFKSIKQNKNEAFQTFLLRFQIEMRKLPTHTYGNLLLIQIFLDAILPEFRRMLVIKSNLDFTSCSFDEVVQLAKSSYPAFYELTSHFSSSVGFGPYFQQVSSGPERSKGYPPTSSKTVNFTSPPSTDLVSSPRPNSPKPLLPILPTPSISPALSSLPSTSVSFDNRSSICPNCRNPNAAHGSNPRECQDTCNRCDKEGLRPHHLSSNCPNLPWWNRRKQQDRHGGRYNSLLPTPPHLFTPYMSPLSYRNSSFINSPSCHFPYITPLASSKSNSIHFSHPPSFSSFPLLSPPTAINHAHMSQKIRRISGSTKTFSSIPQKIPRNRLPIVRMMMLDTTSFPSSNPTLPSSLSIPVTSTSFLPHISSPTSSYFQKPENSSYFNPSSLLFSLFIFPDSNILWPLPEIHFKIPLVSNFQSIYLYTLPSATPNHKSPISFLPHLGFVPSLPIQIHSFPFIPYRPQHRTGLKDLSKTCKTTKKINLPSNLNSRVVSPSIDVEFDFDLNIPSTQVTIDTASTLTVIDQVWCDQMKLKKIRLPNKIPYKDVDGKKHFIKHKTDVILMSIGNGSYVFQQSFYVINSPTDKILFGWDWFLAHRASLDCSIDPPSLKIGTISVPLLFKAEVLGLVRKIEQERVALKKITKSKDFPSEYSKYVSLFDEQTFQSLPPSREGLDMKLEVIPGKILPTSRAYPMSGPEVEAVRKVIEPQKLFGLIRPSTAPNAAPVFFVRKGDNDRRMVINYAKTNECFLKDKSPLPLVSQIMTAVEGAKYFTKLDMPNAFNLLRIRPGDEWKAAFTTPFGAFEPLVVQFGLCNAPGVFQSFMNQIFAHKLYKGVVVYIDDILVYTKSNSLQDHIAAVKEVMDILTKHGLHLRPEKCIFHQTEIEFLGFNITTKGVQIQDKKIEAVMSWKAPRRVKEVQQFLGFANFVRDFVKDFSDIARPLTRLVRNKTPFIWDQDCERSFNLLKQAVTTAPVLHHFQSDLPCIIESDASDFALGAVLLQNIDGILHPIEYYSRRLTGPEINYQVYDKEMLAIVEAFRKWRPYIDGVHTTVYADHKNLEHFKDLKTPCPRQVRWGWELQNFDFDIIHRPGKLNIRADALSRKGEHEDEVINEKKDLTFTILNSNHFVHALVSDPDRKRGGQLKRSTRIRKQLNEDSWTLTSQLNNLQKLKVLTKQGFKLDAKIATELPDLIDEVEPIHLTEPIQTLSNKIISPNKDNDSTDSSTSSSLSSSSSSSFENEIIIEIPSYDDHIDTSKSPPSLLSCEVESSTEYDGDSEDILINSSPIHSKISTESNKFSIQLKQAYKTDPWISYYLKHGIPSHYKRWLKKSLLSFRDGVISYNSKLYIPRSMILKTIQSRHDVPLVGHKGISKTYELLQREFWWPGMFQDVKHFVLSCLTCARIKPVTYKPYGLLHPLKIASMPWEQVSMDFITDLPLTNGNEGIWVVVDRLTKMAHFVPVPKQTSSKDLAQLVINWIIRFHGVPEGITSDRGGQFNSAFWSEVCKELHTRLHLSTAFHPETDGQTEVTNKAVEKYLRAFCNYQQTNWDELLPLAEFAYNNEYHSAIKTSPFFANYGRHPVFDLTKTMGTFKCPSAKYLIANMRSVWKWIRKHIKLANLSYTYFANRKRQIFPQKLKAGDMVWLNRRNIKTMRPSLKLDYKFLGPFKVLKVTHQGLNVTLKLPPSMPIYNTFHISLIKRYIPNLFLKRVHELAPPIIVEGVEEYEVEEILDSKLYYHKPIFLIKFLNYDLAENEWCSLESIQNCPEHIINFFNKYPEKPGLAEFMKLSISKSL